MAPMDRPDIQVASDQIKDVLQGLYQVMVQVSQYDAVGGRPTKDVVSNELTALSHSLQRVHRTAASPRASDPLAGGLPPIPQELIQYVENGRNPDVYTREFVEFVRRGNQLMRGKAHAFSAFRDVLAGEMREALPELRADVDRVVAATGGGGPLQPAGGEAETARREQQQPATKPEGGPSSA